jgi:hypothetical protein
MRFKQNYLITPEGMELTMEFARKPASSMQLNDRAPLFASMWLALFFALRHEYRLVRATR